MTKYEYAVKCWGSAFEGENDLKKFGYREGIYYFDTLNNRTDFIDKMDKLKSGQLMYKTFEGVLVRYHIKANFILNFNNMPFKCEMYLPPYYDYEDSKYALTEGIFSTEDFRVDTILKRYPAMTGLLTDPVVTKDITISNIEYQYVRNEEDNKDNIQYLCISPILQNIKSNESKEYMSLDDFKIIVTKDEIVINDLVNNRFYKDKNGIHIDLPNIPEDIIKHCLIKIV